MRLQIPSALTVEHEALHAKLVALTRLPGKVGAAAREVATLLHPHFEKEEAYALPPLGLLDALSRGTVTPDMADVLPLTDRLATDLGEMLAEHGQVVAALERLRDAATGEGRPEAAAFADALALHAVTEEQVLYPAALLVGRYVKARLGR